jgi:hypothetical protein
VASSAPQSVPAKTEGICLDDEVEDPYSYPYDWNRELCLITGIINNAHVNNEVKAKQQHNYMYVYVSSMVEGISEQNGSFGNFTNYTEVNNCSKKVVV